MLPRSAIVVPTYNEEKNIKPLVEAIVSAFCNSFFLSKGETKSPQDFPFFILFVDDNSQDKTREEIRKVQHQYPGIIQLLERERKEGIGPAYIAGFNYLLNNFTNWDIVIECDADLSHNPIYLPVMINEIMNGYDVVIGSRYVKGGKVENWPLSRILLSRGAALYVFLCLRWSIKDPTSGFVAYKRKVIESLPLNEIKSKGYAFQIEMKYIAYKQGFRIKEIPITFRDREYGTSKMSLKIFHEAFFIVPALPFKNYHLLNHYNHSLEG